MIIFTQKTHAKFLIQNILQNNLFLDVQKLNADLSGFCQPV